MIDYYKLKEGKVYKVIKSKNPSYIGRKVITLYSIIDRCHGEMNAVLFVDGQDSYEWIELGDPYDDDGEEINTIFFEEEME